MEGVWGCKGEAAGSELQIRWEQSMTVHLHGPFCAFWALPVCLGELWTPLCAPSTPWLSLRGYPKPWCPFWGLSPPLVLFCAIPRPQLCLFGLPTALKEPFRVHRTSPWDFLCHRGLWPPLHIPVCVNIAWGSLVHPQPSGCALDYPRAPLEPLATTDPREGFRNTPMET